MKENYNRFYSGFYNILSMLYDFLSPYSVLDRRSDFLQVYRVWTYNHYRMLG